MTAQHDTAGHAAEILAAEQFMITASADQLRSVRNEIASVQASVRQMRQDAIYIIERCDRILSGKYRAPDGEPPW